MRIFLVEDEVLVLRTLKQKILSLDASYEIIGTATNGLEAYGRILESKPDVVLSDIRMPDMDGITLLEKLQSAGFRAITVLVSGYADFSFAQSAIRLGVQDYLLKPVELESLQACLAKCAAALRQSGQAQPTGLPAGPADFELPAPGCQPPYGLVYLIFSNALSSADYIFHPDFPYFPAAELQPLFQRAFPQVSRQACLDGIFSNEKAVVLGQYTGNEDHLRAVVESLLPQLAAAYHAPVTAYCTVSDRNDLARALRSCRKIAARGIMLGKTGVCRNERPRPGFPLSEHATLLTSLVRQGDAALLRASCRKLARAWEEHQRPLYLIQQDLLFLLSSIRQELQTTTQIAENELIVENLLCFSSTYEALASGFSVLLLELFGPKDASLGADGKEQLVASIEQYFQKHLSENITLQDLSEQFNFSKVYLCRVFKQAKNMTLMDYFTRMKISRAQAMLQESPDATVHQVAEALGFRDVYYFTKVFRRITGVSPSQMQTSEEKRVP